VASAFNTANTRSTDGQQTVNTTVNIKQIVQKHSLILPLGEKAVISEAFFFDFLKLN
jgi:hypothetical protein